MSFSFSQVEHALSTVHTIENSKRSAFGNRLKHLQKLGFLPETRTGRGRAASYRGEHALLLELAMQFIELGLTPERAMLVIQDNMEFVVPPIRWAVTALNEETDRPELYFLRFDPSTLDTLRFGDGAEDGASSSVFYAGRGSLTELFSDMGFLWPRLALINMTTVVHHTFLAFNDIDPKLAEVFEADLVAWLATNPERTDGDDSDS